MADDPDEIVRLATAPNPAQAHIWQEELESEGIRCQVVGDYLDAGIGDIPGFSAELWVARKDLERASAILQEGEDAVAAEPDEDEAEPAEG
jgi:hypothetical protein